MKKQKKGIYTVISICILTILCSCINLNQNPLFKISTRVIGNGSITINPSSLATPGSIVTVTFNPELGYRIKQYLIQASVVSGNNNTYTFIMPSNDVTVSAEFELPVDWFITTEDDFGNITITGLDKSKWNSDTDVIITIPSQINNKPVTKIGDYAFSLCKSLEIIKIPNSVKIIGYFAFNGCTSLKAIEIPDFVTFIGDNAFNDCSLLETIEISNSVTKIGESVFSGCRSLKTIKIPDSVTSIGSEAFSNCRSLETIEIPNSVTSIGRWGFIECHSLETIIIPDSVTSIGTSAFLNCIGLENVKMLRQSPPTIGTDCFKNSNKSNIKFSVPNVSLAGYKTALAAYVDNVDTQVIGY